MKNFFIFLLIFILFNSINALEKRLNIISGVISKDLSPYIISEDKIVPPDSTLIIKPGVTIFFQGKYSLKIEGKILAIGTKKDSIYFGALKKEGWKGIELYQESKKDTSIFKYCNFFKADTRNSQYKTEKSALTISHYNYVKLENCTFYSNYANYGGAISIFSSSVYMRNCKFLHNNALFLGGAISISAKSFVKIFNSYFERNISDYYAGAIYIDKGSFCIIGNSLFAKNGANIGGAIVGKSATLHIINSSITANNAMESGALDFSENCDITIINSIIWGNIASKNDNITIDNTSSVEIKFSVTERGDIAENLDNFHTEHLLFVNPKFNLTGNNPFSLSDNSPCIDAGSNLPVKNIIPNTDLAGQKRIAGKSIDIGAFEKNEKSLIEKTNYKLFFLKYNLSTESFEGKITFRWNSKHPVLIKIIDDKANIVKEILIKKPKQGENIFIWNGLSTNNKYMDPGVYFYRIFEIKK